jgi:hypothetical protein
MPNNRIFYASHGVSVGGTTVQGAQSVGVTTNFNLEQAFQLGQLALYNNIVTDPEVEVTVSKALDGEALIWQLATGGGSLVSNANDQSTIKIGVGDDTAAALTNTTAVECTGMYISSLSYTFPVDGNFTEDVTFVGNHKAVNGTVSAPSTSGNAILRRQHLLIGSSTLPSEVTGKNLSSITISADLGRESMYKLGQYAPFHRFVNFPLEVTTEIEVMATTHDGVECDLTTISCTGGDLPQEQQITIQLCDGTTGSAVYTFNMGDKNRLQSVNYTGGDTGGGNVTITYSYSTYNDLTITSPS